MLLKLLSTVLFSFLAGWFWLFLKTCFGILKGGDLEGIGNSYYGGDIVVAGVFSSWQCW